MVAPHGDDVMPEFAPVGFFGGSTGGGEVLLILLVALLLFGAKSLPQIARSLGRTLEEFRRAARDVKDEVMRADLEDSPPTPPAALPPSPPPAKEEPDERVAR